MRFLSFAKIAAGMTLAGIVLAACVVVEEGPSGPPPGAGGPPICTREYDPVCAQRGPDRRTFGNACQADVEGYRVIREGECRGPGGPGAGGPGAGGPGGGRPPQACTREYDPVCATRRGDTRTFPNACEAESADYRIVRRGTC